MGERLCCVFGQRLHLQTCLAVSSFRDCLAHAGQRLDECRSNSYCSHLSLDDTSSLQRSTAGGQEPHTGAGWQQHGCKWTVRSICLIRLGGDGDLHLHSGLDSAWQPASVAGLRHLTCGWSNPH